MHLEMMSKNMIYSTPDYNKAQKLAYEVLEKYSNYELPINLFDIIEKIPNLKIKPYSWFRDKYNKSFEEVSQHFGSDEGILACENGKFIIFYNDITTDSFKQRWIIAHELGHYFFKHLDSKEYEYACFSDEDNFIESDYEISEGEANQFAKHLLVPFPIVMELMDYLTIDAHFIMDIFHINYRPATYIINNINKVSFYNIQMDLSLTAWFKPEINKIVDFIQKIEAEYNYSYY